MIKIFQKQISIPSILKIGTDELKYLGAHLKNSGFNKIACFYSYGIEEIFGEKISKSFAKYDINILHKNTISDINIENVIHTAFNIPKQVEVLIGIGGGKALDYSKYCAHVLSLPFISVPTSTSNDGFCSPNASLIVEGKRKSVPASIPYGVVVDLNAVKSSPENCILSGIGDLISKITSSHDWLEAAKKGNAEFNDFAYLISQNSVQDVISYPFSEINNLKFLYRLTNSLLMSGITMEICGTSRPASGSEHLISHALDTILKEPAMHGIQVGLATYLCSALQNNDNDVVKHFLINTGFFEYIYSHPFNKNDFISAIKLAPSIKEDYYTVLSEPNAIENAISFINTDEVFQKALI